MRVLAENQWTKTWVEEGQKYRMRVTGRLVHLNGNEKPHFSITGEVQHQAKNNRWMDETCGAIHGQIVKHFPELKYLCKVHLSDENGVPMHAAANAAYWAGMTKFQPRDIQKLAAHLRVLPHYAESLADYAEDCCKTELLLPTQAWDQTILDFSLTNLWSLDAEFAMDLLNEKQEVAS